MREEQWFKFLDPAMQDLAQTSYALLSVFANSEMQVAVHDFSFIVFPMAKAYEGFLKKWLYINKLIEEQDYRSDHFRIGRSLNPSLPEKYKYGSYVYDKIVAQSSDPHLADRLWRAWKEGRNLIFHYYPDRQGFLSIQEAKQRVDQFAAAMADAVSCVIR